MTIKQICADCEAVFECEPNPKFPRKYCTPCGAARKKSWDEGGKQIAPIPIAVAGVDVTPVIKAPKGEFHLSMEQVRTNALMAAIKVDKSDGLDNFWALVEEFELYISGQKEKYGGS